MSAQQSEYGIRRQSNSLRDEEADAQEIRQYVTKVSPRVRAIVRAIRCRIMPYWIKAAPQSGAAGRDASASLRPWGPRSARARPWLLGRLLINQPIATTARVEAVKPTHLLARASPGRKSYSAVRSRQAAANRMILWPVPSRRAQPARAEPLSVQSIKQPQLDLHSRLHNPAPIG